MATKKAQRPRRALIFVEGGLVQHCVIPRGTAVCVIDLDTDREEPVSARVELPRGRTEKLEPEEAGRLIRRHYNRNWKG